MDFPEIVPVTSVPVQTCNKQTVIPPRGTTKYLRKKFTWFSEP